MTTSDIIASIALAISGGIVALDVWRHRLPLHMSIWGKEWLGSCGDTAYVLVNLVLINPSQSSQTVYRVEFQPQGQFQIREVPGEPLLERGLVRWPPEAEGVKEPMAKSEDVISWPLDVEPLHSKSGYFVLAVSPIPLKRWENSRLVHPQVIGHIVALNHKGKILQSIDLLIPYPDS
jgi:hypothetical protein